MSFLSGMNISASALTAERVRMDVIAENLANQNNTRTADGSPYRRKFVTFEEADKSFAAILNKSKENYSGGGVKVSAVQEDMSDFKLVYDPNHSDADENGYVRMPNVDTTKEMIDMISATRSYEANITALNGTKSMASSALKIGQG